MQGGFLVNSAISLLSIFGANHNKVVSVHVDSLSDKPAEAQGVWDEKATPLVRAYEKIHRGEELGFDDIYALAKSTDIPEDAVVPGIKISNEMKAVLLEMVKSRDNDGRVQLNAILAGKNYVNSQAVGNTGSEISSVGNGLESRVSIA